MPCTVHQPDQLPRGYGAGNGGYAGEGTPDEPSPATPGAAAAAATASASSPGCSGIAICATFKNNAKILGGWIEYHQRFADVTRVYLYDDGSDDDPMTVLQPLVDRGVVGMINQTIPVALEGVRI